MVDALSETTGHILRTRLRAHIERAGDVTGNNVYDFELGTSRNQKIAYAYTLSEIAYYITRFTTRSLYVRRCGARADILDL